MLQASKLHENIIAKPLRRERERAKGKERVREKHKIGMRKRGGAGRREVVFSHYPVLAYQFFYEVGAFFSVLADCQTVVVGIRVCQLLRIKPQDTCGASVFAPLRC